MSGERDTVPPSISRRSENRSDESAASTTSKSTADSSHAATVSTARTSLGSTSDLVDLPKELDSQETLVYCGFTEEMATMIFDRWDPEARQRWDLLPFVKAFLRARMVTDECGGTEDDWDGYLQACGANKQIRAALTRPGYDDIRLQQTALYWFLWSVESKYMYLEYVKEDSKSHEHGQQIREQHQHHGQPGGISGIVSTSATGGAPTSGSTSTPGGPSTSGGSSTSSGTAGQSGSSAHRSDATPSVPAPGVAFAGQSGRLFPPRVTQPGTTVLWKGCDRIRVEKCWSDNYRRGHFRFDRLLSDHGGDFNPVEPVWYFTTSIAGAKRYAQWARKITSYAGVCLVRIELPNKAINSARPYLLQYPSDEFKQAVYLGRSLKRYLGTLNAVRQAHYLIGDTCRGSARAITKLGDWHQIDEGHLVKVKKDTTQVHDGPEDIASLTPQEMNEQYENVKQHVFGYDFYDSLSDADKAITIHDAVDHTIVFEKGIDW